MLFRRKPQQLVKKMHSMHPWQRLFYAGNDKNEPVVLGKGSQLSASFAFVGHDLRNSSDMDITISVLELDRNIERIASENGFVVHHDLTTTQSEYLRAPWFKDRSSEVVPFKNGDAPAMCKLLGMEREQRHSSLVEPVTFMTLTKQPGGDSMKLLRNIVEGKPSVKAAVCAREKMLVEFREKIRSVEADFSKLGIVTNLNADKMYSYYLYCLTGRWMDTKAPDFSGATFATLMNPSREDDKFGNYFKIQDFRGPMHTRVVTPYGIPPMIRPEYFENMAEINANFRWSSRMILVDKAVLQREYKDEWIRMLESVKDLTQSLKEKMEKGSGMDDPIKAEKAQRILKDLKETDLARYGVYLSSEVVVYAETECQAEHDAARIAKVFLDLQKPVDIESFGSKVAFSISLPGSVRNAPTYDLLPSFPAMSSICLSLPDTGPDVSGSISVTPRPPSCQFTIKGTLPARVDFGNGQNRHKAVIAPVRMGKSTLLQLENSLDLLMLENPFIIQIDVDVLQSASHVGALAMGGSVISFQRGTAALQPLAKIDDPFRFDQAVARILMCVASHGKDASSPEMRNNIVEAMELTREQPVEERTLELFQMLVQDETVKACLDVFVHGAFARYVGGNKNILGTPPYVVVDVSGLEAGEKHDGVVIAMLLDEITDVVQNHKGPVSLRIDELAQVLPLLGDSLDRAYRRWPKKGAGISVVVHDPNDIVKAGDVGKCIKTNTGVWICLGDGKAVGNADYKELMKLDDFHLSLISELRKGEFLIKIGQSVRVIDTNLTPLELFVLGQTGKKSEDLVCRILKTCHNEDDFPVQLLRDGGFFNEAKELEELLGRRCSNVMLAAE